MVYIIPNFGENFMKIRTNISKLQMHEILHKNVIHIFMQIFMSFYDGQLKQQICYSLTLLIHYMFFNPFKMVVWLFSTASSFSSFDGPNAF